MFMHIIWYAYIYSCNTTRYVCQCISCLSGTGAGFVASVFFGYVFLLIYQSFLLARNPIKISSLVCDENSMWDWIFIIDMIQSSLKIEEIGMILVQTLDDEFLDDLFQCSFFWSTKKNIYQIYQARFLFAVQPMKSVQLYAYKYQNLGPTDWGYCECLRWITCHAFQKTYKSLQIFTTKLNCFFWPPNFSGSHGHTSLSAAGYEELLTALRGLCSETVPESGTSTFDFVHLPWKLTLIFSLGLAKMSPIRLKTLKKDMYIYVFVYIYI